MPIPTDYIEIVENLLSATTSGRAKWIRTRFGYQISILESQFKIWSGTDEDNGRGFVSFELADDRGNSLDTWYVDDSEAHYDQMMQLFSGAKRQALGIPKILSSLKEAVKKGGIIGDSGGLDDAPF